MQVKINLPEQLYKIYEDYAKNKDKKPEEIMTEILSRYIVPLPVIQAEVEILTAKQKKIEAVKLWLQQMGRER